MSSKEEMLARIRWALGRKPSPDPPAPLPPFDHYGLERIEGSLVDVLTEELEKVGAHAVQIKSRQEAREYFRELLKRHSPAAVDRRSLGRSSGGTLG